jgi:hypothetical protein
LEFDEAGGSSLNSANRSTPKKSISASRADGLLRPQGEVEAEQEGVAQASPSTLTTRNSKLLRKHLLAALRIASRRSVQSKGFSRVREEADDEVEDEGTWIL